MGRRFIFALGVLLAFAIGSVPLWLPAAGSLRPPIAQGAPVTGAGASSAAAEGEAGLVCTTSGEATSTSTSTSSTTSSGTETSSTLTIPAVSCTTILTDITTETDITTATDTFVLTNTDTATRTQTTTKTATSTVTSSASSSVVSDPPIVPPSASFTWLPLVPQVGQPVSLVSTSAPGSSPIASFAWRIGDRPFATGSVARTVTFRRAGSHLVRLRVTDLKGATKVASKKILVSKRPISLMQPFPVVTVAGSYSAAGASITKLSVQAPAGARILVSCRGSRCPVRHESARGSVNSGQERVIGFAAFERSLRAGLVVRVKVFEHGEIGKLTVLRIRAGKPPKRLDTCIDPAGTAAVSCPA